MHDSQTSDDNPLSILDRIAWAKWARSGIAWLPGDSGRRKSQSLREAQAQVKVLQAEIKEFQRRRAVPFSEAFWD